LAAIKEGRAIFENIRKVILYLVSNSFTEVILIGGAVIFGLPLPLTAAQILWVNLVEDSFPAIALAFGSREDQLMKQLPRSRQTAVLDLKLKKMMLVVSLFTNFLILTLFAWLREPTVIFVALGLTSLFYVLSCQSLHRSILETNPFGNWSLNLSIILGVTALLAAVYFPPLQVVLKTQPLGLMVWLLLFVLSTINLLAIEIAKTLLISRYHD
jgi:Ca2+-transporting ATPase